MKKNNITKGIIAFSALALLLGGLAITNVASAASSANAKAKYGLGQSAGPRGGQKMAARTALTDAQKADLKAKKDAVSAALTNGDYNAWVAAETALNANAPILKKVTADNFSAYADKYKKQAANTATRKTNMDAVSAALNNGDYTAWVAAEKIINANAPILQKITADNFSRYSEAYKLRVQADTIMKDLGLTGMGAGNGGFGLGKGGAWQEGSK